MHRSTVKLSQGSLIPSLRRVRASIATTLFSTLVLACTFSPADSVAEKREKKAPAEIPASSLYPEEFSGVIEQICTHNPQKALRKLGVLSKQHPRRESENAFLMGLSHFRLNDYASAASSLQRAWSLRRSNSDTLYFLAVSLYQLGEKQRAYQLLEEALWFSRYGFVPPETILERLAVVSQAEEQTDLAIGHLKKAINQNPAYIPARVLLGTLLQAQGDSAQAQAHLAAALTKQPETEADPPAVPCSLQTLREIYLSPSRSEIDLKILNIQFSLSGANTAGGLPIARNTIKDLEPLLKLESLSNEQKASATSLLARAHLITRDLPQARTTIENLKSLSPSHPSLPGLNEALRVEEEAVQGEKDTDTKSLE
jgi:tetratricopeptide (TPR) repeat protein